MISLFKREQAYKIAIGEEPKPAEPSYPKKLTKLQFKKRLIAAQAVASASSTTVTLQSREAAAAEASAPPSPVTSLSKDDINDTYQSHKKEWEAHEK